MYSIHALHSARSSGVRRDNPEDSPRNNPPNRRNTRFPLAAAAQKTKSDSLTFNEVRMGIVLNLVSRIADLCAKSTV